MNQMPPLSSLIQLPWEGVCMRGKKCTRQFKSCVKKALKEGKAGVSQAGAYGLGQVSQQRESGIEEHSSRDQVRRGVESV